MEEKPNSPREDSLHRFVDGASSEDEKFDLLDLLAGDGELSERAEAYSRQNHLLRALHRDVDVGRPGDFCPELQAKIVGELVRKRPVWLRPITALAASVAVLAVVGGIYASTENRWKLVIKAPELVKDGEVAAAAVGDEPAVESVAEGVIPPGQWHFPFAPRQVASNATALQPAQPIQWFNGHMHDRLIRQPDLTGHGLQLVDVHVLREKPTPALHLSYHDQAGKKVELFAGLLSHELRAAFNIVADGHISIHWRLGDLMFALIAPSDSPQLLNIVATVSAAVETVSTENAAVELVEPALPEAGENGPMDIAVPAPEGSALFFVPVPRPSYGGETLAVEPPQAVPPNPDEEQAEAL